MEKISYEMPILKDFHEASEIDLSNTLLISGHHILESNKLLLDYFTQKWLLPSNIHVIWKCYSTNSEVLDEYKHSWYNISDLSTYFEISNSFWTQYSNNIKNFVDNLLKNIDITSYNKVIVWDDWGKILQYLKTLDIDTSNFYWIEHTSNWFHRLKNEEKKFPVINVARSEVKLDIESIFVAELAYNNFKEMSETINYNSNVLIVWWWAIWTALKNLISLDFTNITVIDINPEKSDLHNYNIIDVINKNDIIFWCTWEQVVTFDDFSKISKWKSFISLSSWDYEFPVHEIRNHTLDSWVWDNIKYNWNTILNWWFPITFRGLRKAIPSEQIQVTRTLIYWAVKQIITWDIGDKSFIELEKGVQEFIKKSSV